jgi:hypothetical protein
MTPAAPPSILIDALNLAYWCGDPPSLRLPLALLTRLLADGRHAQLVFDASARYRLGDEAVLYAQLLEHPAQVLEVPSGQPADRAILRLATANGACVVSRDKYRDHRRRYRRLIDDPARLLAGSVEDDRVQLPGLGLEFMLPRSAQEALQQLESLLAASRACPDALLKH